MRTWVVGGWFGGSCGWDLRTPQTERRRVSRAGRTYRSRNLRLLGLRTERRPVSRPVTHYSSSEEHRQDSGIGIGSQIQTYLIAQGHHSAVGFGFGPSRTVFEAEFGKSWQQYAPRGNV